MALRTKEFGADTNSPAVIEMMTNYNRLLDAAVAAANFAAFQTAIQEGGTAECFKVIESPDPANQQLSPLSVR